MWETTNQCSCLTVPLSATVVCGTHQSFSIFPVIGERSPLHIRQRRKGMFKSDSDQTPTTRHNRLRSPPLLGTATSLSFVCAALFGIVYCISLPAFARNDISGSRLRNMSGLGPCAVRCFSCRCDNLTPTMPVAVAIWVLPPV